MQIPLPGNMICFSLAHHLLSFCTFHPNLIWTYLLPKSLWENGKGKLIYQINQFGTAIIGVLTPGSFLEAILEEAVVRISCPLIFLLKIAVSIPPKFPWVFEVCWFRRQLWQKLERRNYFGRFLHILKNFEGKNTKKPPIAFKFFGRKIPWVF